MQHDRELLERLSAFTPINFDSTVFRATRRGLDALTPSVIGGRWMLPDETPILYTAVERDGAIAEIAYHWGLLTPVPSKPVMLHELKVQIGKTLKLARADLIDLGVDWNKYADINYERTQVIGAAVAHLKLDGLIAPSARWACDNVMLFMPGSNWTGLLALRRSIEVDWRDWVRKQVVTPVSVS
jgi:hypothetical protein